MACGPCSARRRNISRAAHNAVRKPTIRNAVKVATEAAKGAAELTGLKRKTALLEQEQGEGKDNGR